MPRTDVMLMAGGLLALSLAQTKHEASTFASCEASVFQCRARGIAPPSWCECCDAVACDATLSNELNLTLLDCLRGRWCALDSATDCAPTPRCEAIRSGTGVAENLTIAATVVDDGAAGGSGMLLIVILLAVCLAGVAIANNELLPTGRWRY